MKGAQRGHSAVPLLSRCACVLRSIFFVLAVAMGTMAPERAEGVYNANMEGMLAMMAVYTEADYIYFRLENQPTSHPGCDPTYFVIHQDIPQNRRNQMLAILLAAKTSEQLVQVGYDSIGDCVHGYIRVHRVG